MPDIVLRAEPAKITSPATKVPWLLQFSKSVILELLAEASKVAPALMLKESSSCKSSSAKSADDSLGNTSMAALAINGADANSAREQRAPVVARKRLLCGTLRVML